MSTATPTWETAERVDLSEHIGTITDEHVERFWRDGWVEVKGFVSPELCEQILAHYKEWSGFRWDGWPDDPSEQQEFVAAADRLRTIVREEPGLLPAGGTTGLLAQAQPAPLSSRLFTDEEGNLVALEPGGRRIVLAASSEGR